jgi:hypothetical protein
MILRGGGGGSGMRYFRWWYGTACRPYDPTMFLSDSVV